MSSPLLTDVLGPNFIKLLRLDKEENNASKKGNQQESNKPEHQNRDETRQATEASNSNSSEQSKEG